MKQKTLLKKIKHRYLLIGGSNTGKTSLLLASKLEFVLKEANIYRSPQPESWWLTQKCAFLEVPGRYLGNQMLKKRYPKITGLVITISMSELLKPDQAFHQLALDRLYQRLSELPHFISTTLPCYIIVTKTDLIPGFSEFFSESSIEELNQSWGMSAFVYTPDDLYQVFSQRFNQLLHILNQQLIWRMHQADQVAIRAGIKDFPLEMEKIKAPLFSFVRQCIASSSLLQLRGIYFTSALQKEDASSYLVRPHFIKQLFNLELVNEMHAKSPLKSSYFRFILHPRFLIGAIFSMMVGLLVAWGLSKNVRHDLHDLQVIDRSFAHYQQTIAHRGPIQTRLAALITLLDTLNQYQISEQPIKKFYQRSLQTILMTEIKNHLEVYLRDPINKNLDLVYAALTSYLMLGNKAHFQEAYFLHSISTILPSKMPLAKKLILMKHLQLAVSQSDTQFVLDSSLIKQTRDFLSSLTGFQLGYLILKNMNIEQIPIEKLLTKIDPQQSVFVVQANQTLPQIFTGELFNTIFTQAAKKAAEQAIIGNWILGDDFKTDTSPEIVEALTLQLQQIYVTHYIERWQKIPLYLQLRPTQHLAEIDVLITHLIGTTSPLLAFLKFFHDNTAFAPIHAVQSPFDSLNILVVNNGQSAVLAEVFSALFSLHQHLQGILTASDQKKAAYDFISKNMLHNEIGILEKLRLAANNSPEPIKTWLLEIANETWRLLAIEANTFIDFSLQQNNSSRPTQPIKHYPLILTSENETNKRKY